MLRVSSIEETTVSLPVKKAEEIKTRHKLRSKSTQSPLFAASKTRHVATDSSTDPTSYTSLVDQSRPCLVKYHSSPTYDSDPQTTPRVNKIVSSLIAMLQGVEVLCNLAIMYLYKDDFHLNPASMILLMSVIRLPWAIKPCWALISDTFPLFGYHRKSYVILGAALCCIATTGLGTFGHTNIIWATILLLMYFLGSAICNVIGEALVVEAGRRERTGGAATTISTFFAFRKISFAMMSYFSGFLLIYVQKEQVFIIATFLPLVVMVAACFLVETPQQAPPPTFMRQVQNLKEVVSQPVLKNSTIFILLLMSMPSAGAAIFYFLNNKLHFSLELMGRMALFQSLAGLGGILVYMTLFRTTCLRKLLIWSTIVITPFCFLPIVVVNRWNLAAGIPDSAFVLSDNVLMEFIGEFQVLPVLVLAAQLCPPRLESSIYSFFLSAYNLGLAIGAVLSAGITSILGVTSDSFENLPALIALCAVTNYLPLLVLYLVPEQQDIDLQLQTVEAIRSKRGEFANLFDEETMHLCHDSVDSSQDEISTVDYEFSDDGLKSESSC
eukprot:Lankesteria_metandrocarpae@DN2969_c0_g1_i1.p1